MRLITTGLALTLALGAMTANASESNEPRRRRTPRTTGVDQDRGYQGQPQAQQQDYGYQGGPGPAYGAPPYGAPPCAVAPCGGAFVAPYVPSPIIVTPVIPRYWANPLPVPYYNGFCAPGMFCGGPVAPPIAVPPVGYPPPVWGGARPGWGGGPYPAPYAGQGGGTVAIPPGGFRRMSFQADSGYRLSANDGKCEIARGNNGEVVVIGANDLVVFRESGTDAQARAELAVQAFTENDVTIDNVKYNACTGVVSQEATTAPAQEQIDI